MGPSVSSSFTAVLDPGMKMWISCAESWYKTGLRIYSAISVLTLYTMISYYCAYSCYSKNCLRPTTPDRKQVPSDLSISMTRVSSI